MSTVLDLREEVDGSCVSVQKPQLVDGKAKFLIRTLPRECNPTPVTPSLANAAAAAVAPASSAMLSPTARSRTSQTDLAIQELDNPFDDITEEKLQQASGRQDLSRVTSLRISVDTGKQSAEVIGELLPSLRQLTLDNSVLYSFRDLGTSLHSLQVLSVARSGITDLDGIGALTCLQQLYVQHNRISDISPLSMHEELQVVDLEGNCVSEIGQIEQLAFCHQLQTLSLVGNPVCSVSAYRQIVANFVPQLSTLDGKLLTSADRGTISEAEVEAAIRAHSESIEAAATLSLSPSCGSMSRLPLANGDVSSPLQCDPTNFGSLSRSSSVKRIGMAESTTFDTDDAGSSLTHGTDIVFAGNVTSALRRHRSESEAESPRKLAQPPSFLESTQSDSSMHEPGTGASSALGARPSTTSRAGLDRPKTPARMSITDTLDRAHELDAQAQRSRDSIMNELRAWQLESVGASVLGVTFDDQTDGRPESPSTQRASQRKGSNSNVSAAPVTRTSPKTSRRPNTSAGVVRDGWSVREAFTEERPGSSSSSSGSSRSRPSLSKHRHSIAGMGSSSAPPSVDILILDDDVNGGDDDDSKRPCSPVKTPHGIYTAAPTGTSSMDGRYRRWNLDALSPAIDTSNARHYLPSSLSVKEQQDRVFQHARSRRLEEEGEDEDASESDGDDHPHAESPDRPRGPRASDKVKRQPSAPRGAFFNVAASLDAIDKWRDQVDDDQEDGEDGSSSSSKGPSTSVDAMNTSSSATVSAFKPLGPATKLSDDEIVQRLKTKHTSVAETKTREGFRRFFSGIEADRLEGILRRVFTDPDKVRRRMQLMDGHFTRAAGTDGSV